MQCQETIMEASGTAPDGAKLDAYNDKAPHLHFIRMTSYDSVILMLSIDLPKSQIFFLHK